MLSDFYTTLSQSCSLGCLNENVDRELAVIPQPTRQELLDKTIVSGPRVAIGTQGRDAPRKNVISPLAFQPHYISLQNK